MRVCVYIIRYMIYVRGIIIKIIARRKRRVVRDGAFKMPTHVRCCGGITNLRECAQAHAQAHSPNSERALRAGAVAILIGVDRP